MTHDNKWKWNSWKKYLDNNKKSHFNNLENVKVDHWSIVHVVGLHFAPIFEKKYKKYQNFILKNITILQSIFINLQEKCNFFSYIKNKRKVYIRWTKHNTFFMFFTFSDFPLSEKNFDLLTWIFPTFPSRSPIFSVSSISAFLENFHLQSENSAQSDQTLKSRTRVK